MEETAPSPTRRVRGIVGNENRRGFGRLLLFFFIVGTWIPVAFLIEWLVPQSLLAILLWLAYAVGSVLMWERFLYRRYGPMPWILTRTK